MGLASGNEHEDEFFGGAGGGLQFMGVLNALRTGDPMLDMVIAMCLPTLMRFIFGGLSRLVESFKFDIKLNDEHERRIVHTSSKNAYGDLSSDDDQQNTILIKAINLYLHNQLKLELREAYVDLTSTEDKNASVGRSRYNYYYDSDNDDDQDSKTVVGALSKYRIVQKPPPNQWHDLGFHGDEPVSAPVKLKIDIIKDERNDGSGRTATTQTEITHSYHFKSSSGEAIDAFVQKAYSWYMDELRNLEDNARYFYELKATDPSSKSLGCGDGDEDGNRSSDSRICYKRYRLSDEKTFASLFFRQKESVLKLLNHFQAKTGKYDIQGYPYKLGFLLHGPPGSGKSSAIKALAQYTGRSIINVPLSRVSTNTELMSIFFDIRKYVEGESVPVKLGFKDVIFVMEDVDAASKVVKRRDGKKASALSSHTSTLAMGGNDADGDDLLPSPKSFFRLLLESNEEDCKELAKILLERSTRLQKEAAKPELMKSIAERVTALPGLGLVGDVAQTKDNVALQRIGNDALRTAKQSEADQSTVDRYLASQARILLNMLEQQEDAINRDDAEDDGDTAYSESPRKELDDDFVDELLLSSQHDYSFSTVPFPLYENDNVTAVTSPLSVNDSDDDDMPSLLNAPSFSQLMDKSPEKTKLPTAYGAAGPSPWGKSSSLLKDELNLTGLLNVLDGVVDSPGRIVIMTTNHVDHLDPALIRPGRIDKKLLLGYMEAVDVLSMLEHYFQLTLTEKQRARVETAMIGHMMGQKQPPQLRLKLTPAQVEQLMAEHDEIEDMIAALEHQGRVGNVRL